MPTPGAASNYLDASPGMGRGRLPELSELAGAREGGAGVMEVAVGGLGDEGAVDVALTW